MTDAKKADKPFFPWWNSTRMHIWMRLKKEREGKTALEPWFDKTWRPSEIELVK